MFSRIKEDGDFELSSGVRSSYRYEYERLSDAISEAYCTQLKAKLDAWQKQHGNFNAIIGCETEGIRIGYQLSCLMDLPFHIMPKKRIDFDQILMPGYPDDTHWLVVDDIVTTGSTFIKAVDYLDIEEKPESITFTCMIKRNPANLDYSAVTGDSQKEQFHVRGERFDFIDKRLVALFSE